MNANAKTEYILASQKKTQWRIITGINAPASERHAAEELKNFLEQICGAVFPILEDDAPYGRNEIIVGNNRHLEPTGLRTDFGKLGEEGFRIRTADGNLIIVGGGRRGTLYGVYTFLEDYLGCRWLYRGVSKIPARETIAIGDIDDEQIPVLEYRDPFFAGSLDGDWHARNKSNSQFAHLEDIHGYRVAYTHFVHTFDSLVPVKEYFETHPEYFSEVDGKRISENTQLCLTNPEVLEIAVGKVRQWLREEPRASIVSVSQNDWANPCQCEKCKAIDDYEGAHSGTLIHFVNQVAEAIEKEFPHVAVDTLAYQYTRKPPKHVRPRKNVIVRLCSIECCFSHPLSDCKEIASFKKRDWVRDRFSDDLEAWSKVCDRLHIWDYVTNFANYIQPFPNFKVLQANIRYFVKNNVKGIFEEGNASPGESSEFDQMRQYVLAKLLWNPEYDVDSAIQEFMTGYYGMAAASMKQYFDLIHKQVEAKDMHMGIYDPPDSPYLNEDMLAEADRIFDKAETLADDETVLKRVRTARLPIRYVRLSVMPADAQGRQEMLDRFFQDVKEAGIVEIREGWTLEKSMEYLRDGIILRHNP